MHVSATTPLSTIFLCMLFDTVFSIVLSRHISLLRLVKDLMLEICTSMDQNNEMFTGTSIITCTLSCFMVVDVQTNVLLILRTAYTSSWILRTKGVCQCVGEEFKLHYAARFTNGSRGVAPPNGRGPMICLFPKR